MMITMPKPARPKMYPLERIAKVNMLFAILVNIAVWAVVLYYYVQLPNTIPTHYGLNGTPDAYGSKLIVLIEPVVLTLLVAYFTIAIRFRYTILSRYPYLVRLPAFVYGLESGRNAEVQGRLLNKVFTVYTIPMAMISILNALISWIIISEVGTPKDTALLLGSVFLVVAFMVAMIFLRYRSIYREFS